MNLYDDNLQLCYFVSKYLNAKVLFFFVFFDLRAWV